MAPLFYSSSIVLTRRMITRFVFFNRSDGDDDADTYLQEVNEHRERTTVKRENPVHNDTSLKSQAGWTCVTFLKKVENNTQTSQ